MRLAILLIFIVVAYTATYAQSKAEVQMNYKGNSYDTYTVLIDSSTVKRFDIVQNTIKLPHKDMMAKLSGNGKSIMAINAAVSDHNCNTEGMLIIDSTMLRPINLQHGQGNFYLMPNGVLLFTATTAAIVESGLVRTYTGVVSAVQSGPMLVSNNKINANFSTTSTNKNIRCGVGIYKQGGDTYLVFAVANNAVSFYDFATLFVEKYKCTDALCLESAGCAMYVSDLQQVNANGSHVICNYIIYNED